MRCETAKLQVVLSNTLRKSEQKQILTLKKSLNRYNIFASLSAEFPKF